MFQSRLTAPPAGNKSNCPQKGKSVLRCPPSVYRKRTLVYLKATNTTTNWPWIQLQRRQCTLTVTKYHKHDFNYTRSEEIPKLTRHYPGHTMISFLLCQTPFHAEGVSTPECELTQQTTAKSTPASHTKVYLNSAPLRYGLYAIHNFKYTKQRLSNYTAMSNISKSSLHPHGIMFIPDLSPREHVTCSPSLSMRLTYF